MAVDILDRIVAEKWREVEARRTVLPLAELEAMALHAGAVRGFTTAIKNKVSRGQAAVIAELKKSSPSRGVIREHFDPAELARTYESAGATCLSVLTDVNFFAGSDDNLTKARKATTLPVLRKDFIVDPWQVYEARSIGADCVLLIAAILSSSQMESLFEVATKLNMDVLVEVHSADELAKALELSPALIGINNRDLKTFEVDLETSRRLVSQIPEDILVVTESGIHTAADVALIRERGIHGFLIGEALMKEEHPGEKLRELFPA